ncbi:MAG: zinc-finger domain-containing protein [Proteobacteria bacterium]|nr:zinc-finger domain-containing protein [Pseudomonadota bacterium]NOG60714.1 zinc-finger domain-containing protein [Pseudomonadota bacterium]
MAETSTSKEPVFHIKKEQLPLHCPLPEMSLWNQHPKVFLPIEESGKSKCPYCGTEFILEE